MLGVATARAHGEGVYSHLFDKGNSASGSYALWSSMHDSGRLKLTREGRQAVLFEMADYAVPSEEMCLIVTGYTREGLRLSGRTPPQRSRRPRVCGTAQRRASGEQPGTSSTPGPPAARSLSQSLSRT